MDDPDILLATSILPSGWGYRVFGGAMAAEAIQDIETNGGGAFPDLVLSDFNLLDGQTAVHALAEVNRKIDRDIPAIIITGDPSAPGIKEAQALDYEIILKPLRAHCCATHSNSAPHIIKADEDVSGSPMPDLIMRIAQRSNI